MSRLTIAVALFVSLAFAGQIFAIPANPKPAPQLHHYVVSRLEAYKNINCEEFTKPDRLSTPNPVLGYVAEPIVVNFIIGEDGRVHSTLILNSDTVQNNREVIRAVRSWRFRPATCDGARWETEATVGFGTY